MGYFGNFSNNRPTAANNGSKIVSRVLFWYPGICATQIHLRSSICVSNADAVPFFKAKNRHFLGILGQIPAPPEEPFLDENTILPLKSTIFCSRNKNGLCRGPTKSKKWVVYQFRYFSEIFETHIKS